MVKELCFYRWPSRGFGLSTASNSKRFAIGIPETAAVRCAIGRLVAVALLLLAQSADLRAQITHRLSGQVIPGTEGITPGPGVQLDHRELMFANLETKDLADASFMASNLTEASLSGATLTNANLAGAVVTGARLSRTNLTESQLQSTANFQSKDLRGIWLSGNDLTGWDFSGQNLTEAWLYGATLTNANLTAAVVNANSIPSHPILSPCVTVSETFCNRGTDLGSSNLTLSQLQSTASYQSRNLTGISLQENDLTGWDFSGQNLTKAWLGFSSLADANLTGANLTDASLSAATLTNANFANAVVMDAGFGFTDLTESQLRSTASYQSKDLSGIRLEAIDLTGWDLSGQNLTRAEMLFATLTNANLTGARLMNTSFQDGDDLSSAIFDSASVYNQWTVFPDGFDPVAAGLTFQATPVGDFDGDGQVDAMDLRELEERLSGRRGRERIYGVDVNGDGPVTVADAEMWVDEIKRTWRGDANLDGMFDSTDLTQVFAAGEYEDGLIANSTWATGDWNFDGEFSTDDLIVAFQGGGYEQGPRASVAAVPEPSTWLLGLLTLPAILRRVRA